MKPEQTTRPNIFEYNNFRLYLQDFFNWRHSQDSDFTKASVCRELGLPNSRSYFQDVLNGKYVSPLKVPLFIKLFGLQKPEAQYFRILVNYNQTFEDPEERELLFDQLISLNHTPKCIIDRNSYAYYKHWYNSVIRALLNIIDFKDDYIRLAKSVIPEITVNQARDSIKLLTELELIAPDSRGFLKPTEKVISTTPLCRDEIILQYQQSCLEIAKKSILINQGRPQRVITKVISVSEEGFKRIEKRLQRFNSEITTIVHKDEKPADRVYQLDLLLYPHSKEKSK